MDFPLSHLSLSVDSLLSYGPPLFSPAFPLAERPTHYVLGQRLTGNRNTRSNPQDRMDSGIWSLPCIRPRIANRVTLVHPYCLRTSCGAMVETKAPISLDRHSPQPYMAMLSGLRCTHGFPFIKAFVVASCAMSNTLGNVVSGIRSLA